MNPPDMLEIVNGPEDGTEFPISRAPVIVGMDLDCGVNVRLDESVERFHARLTAVPDGYRVRKIRGGRLLVGGKRAGVFRSRILRDGGIMKVGDTEFCLTCAPDGLAKRSRGLPAESDLFWTLRTGGARLLGMTRRGIRRPRGAFGRLVRLLSILFVGAMAAGYFWPGTARRITGYATHYTQFLLEQFRVMTGGPF